jgi:hypothetical protein
VLGGADLVERLAKVAGDMEAVETDLGVCSLDSLPYRRDEGLPHVHGDRSDLVELILVGVESFLERCLLAIIEDVDDHAALPVHEHGDVVMSLLERRLVDG